MQSAEERFKVKKLFLSVVVAAIFLIFNFYVTFSASANYKDYSRIKSQPLYSWKETIKLSGRVDGIKRIRRKNSVNNFLIFEDIELGRVILQPNSFLNEDELDKTNYDGELIKVDAAFARVQKPRPKTHTYVIKKLWSDGILKADTSHSGQRKKQIYYHRDVFGFHLLICGFIDLFLITLWFAIRSMNMIGEGQEAD